MKMKVLNIERNTAYKKDDKMRAKKQNKAKQKKNNYDWNVVPVIHINKYV